MLGIALCAIALVGCFAAGYRSLVAGLCALMTVGYAYGIVRANVPVPLALPPASSGYQGRKMMLSRSHSRSTSSDERSA